MKAYEWPSMTQPRVITRIPCRLESCESSLLNEKIFLKFFTSEKTETSRSVRGLDGKASFTMLFVSKRFVDTESSLI